MRASILFCLVPAVFFAAASPSPANVIISNAATANMTCSGGVCAPTAADAVLNEQDLEAMLASGNATVTTTGSGVQAKDIHVKAKLTWSAATTLALDAYHSIEVNAKVSVAGTGGVSLTTNDGGIGGDFACKDNGRLVFSSLSSTLSINGTPYMLVNTVASLASAIASNPSGAFAFAKNYDAKKDGAYTSSPIATVFTGSFNGLGNTIFNLSINDATQNDYVGLFAETGTGSTIANVRLVNESVQGGSDSSVGGLAGSAGGSVAHSFTTGTISGSNAGGLLGWSGRVTASGSAAAVSGVTAGGLVGSGGGVTDSWATGNVSGNGSGYNNGYVGGLVGVDMADITHSWASGQVSGTDVQSAAGGLAGEILGLGSIERSHASGAVVCATACGGLLGAVDNMGKIRVSQSYATGTVTSVGSAGGLVGDTYDACDECEIANSYALGAVNGSAAGGLMGQNGISVPYHSISSSYATGVITSTNLAGGLIGADPESPHSLIKHTYWDTTTSGITNGSQGAGNIANDPGIKGLSDKKLKSGLPRGFDPKIWNEDSKINGGLPYLINNPPAN